ncbi:unnamed protein product [Scytosiphon promiscuus]
MKACALLAASRIVACTILLGLTQCGRASSTPSAEETMTMTWSVGGPAVSKTVFSDKMRLVFLVGLEGAGHHYFTDAAKAMFREHPSLLHNGTMFQSGSEFYIPNAMGKSSADFEKAVRKGQKRMEDLAQLGERLPPPGSLKIFKGKSFPSGFGVHRAMQYVDPRLTAEAAEAEGVDLRVVYLKRSAKELILADTVHRQFQTTQGKHEDHRASPGELFMENFRIMLTDAAVVQSFLAELDPAFVACHDWHVFGDPVQAQTVADFIAPSPEVASWVQTALTTSASGGSKHDTNETIPFDRDGILSSRLQRKLDSFEHLYCGEEISWT